ncbi:hypothetical protein ABEG75_11455 [Pantoea agglomerans]|uniref:hypothetical protein n=1 Tax=Enterobacter agglomerans TaxID=549 RepID=UPI0005341FFE|nr:hypothetical protein [Pantoea agglomerans]QAV44776.1 hypothetical protein D1629_09115 [Pantoea agglomerans]QAV49616.1 hypothetical protein D1628_10125 [Pantoea agglomerans]
MSSFWGRLMISLRDSSEQRISNPLYGAFIFSWLSFNWKAIAIFLFSERSIYLKIDDIETVTNINSLLYNPSKMTFVLVLIIPALNAIYALFNVAIKGLHNFSDLYDSYMTSVFSLRKERVSAKIITEREKTLALQKQEIAEAEKRTEQLNLEAALARKNIKKLEDIEKEYISKVEEVNNLVLLSEALENQLTEKDKKISEIKEFESGYQDMLDEVDRYRKEIEEGKQQIASVNSQNRALIIELSDCKDSLDTAKNSLQQLSKRYN